MPGHDTEKLRSITDAQAQGVVGPSIPAAEVFALTVRRAFTV